MKTRQCIICPNTTTRARFRHPPERTVCSQTCAMALARSERRHSPTPARRAKIMTYVIQYKTDHDGLSPSYRQISLACAVPSTNTVLNAIIALEAQGKITRHPRGLIVPNSHWTHPNPPEAPAPFAPTAPACPVCPNRSTCTIACTLIIGPLQRAADRRTRILAYLTKYKTANNGLSPAYREISRICAIPAHSVVSHHLDVLETQGHIARHGRGLIVTGGHWIHDAKTLEVSENLKGLQETQP